MIPVHAVKPTVVAHAEPKHNEERPDVRAVLGNSFVTAVVAGRVVAVPRNSVLVGADGSLTLPVQDDM